MSDNIAQWLAEVRSLQQQINSLKQEQEQAYQSAENWRKLYESEAQQRRRDAAVSRQKIEKLEQAQAHYQNPQIGQHGSQRSQLESALSAGLPDQPTEALQSGLLAVQEECERLKRSLQAEEKAHEQTRTSLTAALGDAVDLLTKERLLLTQPPTVDLKN